ncbi:DUF3095 domain-containing protein [Nodosilinea sp. LEGE 07298]|uniref:DUF3095 domain-containing protein n=1 Tax=Nodosilinea sp. LEGE 07298 TaxID=2777970 RepID=UPI001880DBFF|nr:DUF3095 domain-containing protein [Nodosilinea sp. LEGE 07298]MBE9112293.1 DUF3095 domain-containing protein [Nodosilinea sp. LEGE 07298]
MASDTFYTDLPPLEQFLDLANPRNYVEAPADWYALITDVVASSQAIARGQYKEVNVLGASSIMAVLNAVAPLEVPFVFGGDGALLLVPPSAVQAARAALLGIRTLARDSFGLDLRVGIVPLTALGARHAVRVAKFRLSPTYCQASFIGGGLTYATELVKADPAYRLDVPGDGLRPVSDHRTAANLAGLECRWQDIPSPRGHTLSLIVAALPSGGYINEYLYREVLETIHSIYGEWESYHPVAPAALKISLNPWRLRAEAKARAKSPQWRDRATYTAGAYLESLLGLGLMRFDVQAGGVDWGRYKADVRAASDYQKIDDMLRMVIAGSPAQTDQMVAYLDDRLAQGHLVYGVHISDRALMTCLIMNRRDRHFHLIDGADGGYALAAQQLKARLQGKAQNWQTYSQLARRRQNLGIKDRRQA